MDFLHDFLGPDLNHAGLIILNLIVIESLLSVDNAAVLATMVMDLPKQQRGRALRIGLIMGYIFRGACLILASFLMQIKWLKLLGGAYLLWLAISFFWHRSTPQTSDDDLNKKENWLYKATKGRIGPFWSTVMMVESMDLIFSIDNVFAAVAYVENVPQPYNIRLVMIGVFIGILAMRFIAQIFVKLMGRFPFLEVSAFLVLAILGIKLCIASICDYYPGNAFCEFMEANHHHVDMYFSALTMGLFFIPVLTSMLFNYPKRRDEPEETNGAVDE